MDESSSSVILDGQEIRDSKTAEKYFSAAADAERNGDRIGAIEAYEAAYMADPDHSEVCFKLAYMVDLIGEEDEAIHLYEQCVQKPRPALNALLNLAVMYEDAGHYSKAERCIRQVLATNPSHERGRLFLKDVLASKAMVVEEDQEQWLEKQKALLDTPVTDFDLTVRTRNALRKMNIRTLADLLAISEAELRSYKSLGDASIEEIAAMLAQRGLRLGMLQDQQNTAARQAVYDRLATDSGSDEEAFNRPVGELNLSVRARKALSLLSVQTIGDLCIKTEAELMGIKNFGITSLLEIKEKLTEVGLGLRKIEES